MDSRCSLARSVMVCPPHITLRTCMLIKVSEEPHLVETKFPMPASLFQLKYSSQLVVNSRPDDDSNWSNARSQRRERRDAAYAVLRDKPHRDGNARFRPWQ